MGHLASHCCGVNYLMSSPRAALSPAFCLAGRLPYEPRTESSEDCLRMFFTQSGYGISRLFCDLSTFVVLQSLTRYRHLLKSWNSAGLSLQSREGITKHLWFTETILKFKEWSYFRTQMTKMCQKHWLDGKLTVAVKHVLKRLFLT